MDLKQRRVIIIVTGGIAAYKSAELVRRLRDDGADVRVVMTDAARAFITPLTLQAVSGHPVHESLLDPAAEAAMGHIELARWAELIVAAPASADFLARLRAGFANDLASTLCLAARSAIAVAPAMNQAMWNATATQENVQALQQRGVHVWGPASGLQACGDVGPGRMLEPEAIVDSIRSHFQASTRLAGRHVVITAGPTREAIDPVRFISNHSSGKMGFAIACAARDAGARVTLITGPVSLATPPGVERHDVQSANDMLEAARSLTQDAQVFIATAAVADYRPQAPAAHKIKKTGDGAPVTLALTENTDIVATIARNQPRPFMVGFAAETRDVLTYARAKRVRKALDMIVANDVSTPGTGFNSDQNAVTVIADSGEHVLALADKREIARQLIGLIAEEIERRDGVCNA